MAAPTRPLSGRPGGLRGTKNFGGNPRSDDSSRAGSGGKKGEASPQEEKHKIVIEVDFRNAYSEAVRDKCVK